MSKRDARLLLQDMIESILKIETYTRGMSYEAFMEDSRTVDAVLRNLEIIGEAARQMPESYRSTNAGIPWTQLAGLRNRIVHDYAGVDLELVWNVLHLNLLTLKQTLTDAL